MRLGRLKWLAVLALALTGLLAPAAADARPLRWSAPRLIDGAPFGQPLALRVIRCRGDGACLAGDIGGGVRLRPRRGAGWVLVARAKAEITGLACPDAVTCLAVDAGGELLKGGYRSSGWSVSRIHRGPLTALACAGSTACVAVDPHGRLVTSTDPLARSARWTPTPFDVGAAPGPLACASSGVCVLGDRRGAIFTTSSPGDPGSWQRMITGPAAVLSASCPSAKLCAAGDATGGVLASRSPLDPTAWVQTGGVSADRSGLSALSCPAVDFCVAATQSGLALATGAPDGAPSGWTTARLHEPLGSLSCVTPNLCAGGSPTGDVLSTVQPGGGSGAWVAAPAAGVTALLSLSCVTPRACLAGDDAGRLLRSGDSGASWTSTRSGAAGPGGSAYPSLYGIACPPASARCLALATGGDVPGAGNQGGGAVFSFRLSSPGSAWAPVAIPNQGSRFGFDAISCPTALLCLALDDSGLLHAATERASGRGRLSPAEPAARWSAAASPAQTALEGAVCAGVICVRSGRGPGALRITGPRGTRSFGLAVGRGNRIIQISCPTDGFCAALDSAGEVFSASRPLSSGPRGWQRSMPLGSQKGATEANGHPTALACPRPGVCLVVDSLGRLAQGR